MARSRLFCISRNELELDYTDSRYYLNDLSSPYSDALSHYSCCLLLPALLGFLLSLLLPSTSCYLCPSLLLSCIPNPGRVQPAFFSLCSGLLQILWLFSVSDSP